jgi:hypothetical protein
MEERRRSPRHTVEHGELAVLPYSITVQVLDISVGGVLLHSSRPVAPGERGSLRLNVGGQAFSAGIEVQRVSAGSVGGDSGYSIGAMFVAISPEHRQVIERFTNQ